jgi:putative salt-induced outer membrane protein
MPIFAPPSRLPRIASVLALCLLSSAAVAAESLPALPAGVEAMIRQAAADGDAATLDKTINLALAAFPAQTEAISALGTSLRQQREAQTLAAKRANGRHLLSGWAGSGEFGASLSSGNSDDKALAFGLALSKETQEWRHRISAAADYQRSDGETSKQRYSAGYEPNYFINEALYAAGQFGWERDLFAGYRHRFTETVGLGYVLIDNGVAKLEVEGGPGARHTLYAATETDPRYTENEFVFRAAADFTYQFSDDASFSQSAKTLIGAENRTVEATSALTTRINSLFSAKISFTVRNESDPPDDRRATDTVSRATLVYSF